MFYSFSVNCVVVDALASTSGTSVANFNTDSSKI